MLYKCIFLCFLFIIKRYGDDSKRYVVATKIPTGMLPIGISPFLCIQQRDDYRRRPRALIIVR